MSLDELVGQELGAYTIEEPLGHGNMGKVYRARLGDAPRPVALKVIRRIPGLGHDLVARFQREKEAMSQLGHPNILPIYDYASNSDYLWIAMLLVHGGTLHEKMQRERLDLNEVKTYLGQLAWALDYAHTQGVIHRDIKPQNVLIDRQGKVYLTDFGIAKMLEQQGLTLPGATVGTPEYMSPEQVRGQPVEARSDQYSLGVLAYQMACGKVPFEGQMMQVMTQHAKSDPPNPRKLNPDLPDGAAKALLKALAKKPADRYETCTDFAEAFAEGLEGKAGGMRLPRYWWVAIVVAVILAAGAWKSSRPGTVEGKKSPTPAVKATKKARKKDSSRH